MIISFKHKFIYVSIPKIATTSAHAMFNDSGILGDQDIFTGYREDATGGTMAKDVPPRNLPVMTTDEIGFIHERPVVGHTFKGKVVYTNPTSVKFTKIVLDKIGPEAYEKMNQVNLLKNLTLQEIINCGIISIEELQSYQVYGFIRDPIERYISAFFFERYSMGLPATKQDLIGAVYALDHSYGPISFINRPYSLFFECQGKRYGQPLDYRDYKYHMKRIIESYGGTFPESMPNLKGDIRPEWSRQPYKNWIPKDCLDTLGTILGEDIKYYLENTA